MSNANMIESKAHSAGLTLLAFSPDGRYIYTAGQEGTARVWDTRSDSEPEVLGAQSITAIAAAKAYWFLATSGVVNVYKQGSIDLEETPIRIAGGLPINGLSVEPTGRRLAVAADDNQVRLLDIESKTVVMVIAHNHGVRHASWHPTDQILVSSVSDGSVVVWKLDTPEPTQLSKIDGILPFVSEPEEAGYFTDCAAVWHPMGMHFLIVTRTGDVHTYESSSWKKDEGKITLDKTLGPVTAVAISPNGLYIALAYKSKVVACSYSTQKAYIEHKLTEDVTRIAFSPSDDLLAWVDNQGEFIRLPDYLPKGWAHPAKKSKSSKTTANDDIVNELWNNEVRGTDPMDEEDAPVVDGIDDQFDPIDADDAIFDLEDENDGDNNNYPREMVSVTKAQPPFQPGASPMENKKRYLAHNTIGVIEVTEMENHNVVNIEFYDKSTRRGYSFQDTSRYCFAALGERGAVFANLPDNNSATHRLTYKPYSTWGTESEKEWTFALPASERIVAVAAGGVPPRHSMKFASEVNEMEGNGWAIAATSAGFVRFFSGTGMQRYVWAVGGTVIAMVAGSEWVFVVHREGGTSLDGCQNLRYTLVALETFELFQTGLLPLPKRRTLTWIGVTDEGAPAMYDSAGILFILDRFRRPSQGRWVPILDTNALERRKGKDESYWPVGLTETAFMCLILKGRQTYPGFPRPLLQSIDVHIPLWAIESLKEGTAETVETAETKEIQVEEQLLRNELYTTMLADSLGEEVINDEVSRREMAMDKELLVLMQGVCKTGKLQRALELASLLHHAVSFDSAIKMARFYSHPGLEERITALKDEFLDHDRYARSREERRTWYQHAAPIRALSASGSNLNETRQEPVGFSTNGHVRRALAPAAPLSHANPFANGRTQDPRQSNPRRQTVEVSSTLDTDLGEESFDVDEFSPPNSVKRKRIEEPGVLTTETRGPKRRVMEEPATKSGNPFARKNAAPKSTAVQKIGAPFSRAEPSTGSSISDRAKTKPKEATKQTTLFGLRTKTTEKKAKPNTTSNHAAEDDVDSQATTQTLLNAANDDAAVEGDDPPSDNEAIPVQQTNSLQVDDDIPWEQSPPPSTATLADDPMVQ